MRQLMKLKGETFLQWHTVIFLDYDSRDTHEPSTQIWWVHSVCGILDFQGEVCAGDRTAESLIRRIFRVTRNRWVQTACSFSGVTPFLTRRHVLPINPVEPWVLHLRPSASSTGPWLLWKRETNLPSKSQSHKVFILYGQEKPHSPRSTDTPVMWAWEPAHRHTPRSFSRNDLNFVRFACP